MDKIIQCVHKLCALAVTITTLLLKDEMSYADSGYSIAALDVDDEDE